MSLSVARRAETCAGSIELGTSLIVPGDVIIIALDVEGAVFGGCEVGSPRLVNVGGITDEDWYNGEDTNVVAAAVAGYDENFPSVCVVVDAFL